MKRMFAFILVMFFALSAIPGSIIAASSQYTSPELQRAVKLGIGAYSKNTTVTYGQFFKMLDAAVKLSNPKKLAGWKAKFPKARASAKTMTRQEGMLAVYYAAEALGEDYCKYNAAIEWTVTNQKMGNSYGNELMMDYPLFPGWKQPTTIATVWGNHMTAAYFYSFGRESQYSGRSIFDLDPVKNSMRIKDPFKYEEALLAALRLHDSNLQMVKRVPTEKDKTFLNQADARRAAILNSMTEVNVTGTSYYVSNKGSDENDGLSPATAWATLKKVNTTALKPGDGVFFQRGGIWRSGPWKGDPSHCGNGVLYAQNSVTYSAYGTGEKPKLLGSPENGADPGKWKLLTGTKNIWVFYKDIQDCGGILLNDGEHMAQKTCAFWDGSRYYKSSDGTMVDTPSVPFDVKTMDNTRFFNDIAYPGKEAGGHFSLEGKLYFRCDEGNPGNVYKSMEFLTGNNDWNQGFTTGQDGCVFDNLCFLYGVSGVNLINNCTIQNCEVGWNGGQTLDFAANNLGIDIKGIIVRSGDGIANFGVNNTIRNNYIHHTYDHGITIEGFASGSEVSGWKRDRITISGNITEYCYGCITIADYYAWAKKLNLPSFNNFDITNNYFLWSGYGWSHQEAAANIGCMTMYFHPNSINHINITNNIFYLSKYSLVRLASDTVKNRPNLSGNTYVQDAFGVMIDRILENPSVKSEQNYLFIPELQGQTAVDVLGDKTALFFDQP